MRLALAIGVAVLTWSAVPALSQPNARNANRAMLEQQVRERAAAITRERLGLNDAQMQQLQRVNTRFGPQLSAILMEERSSRRQLRQELMAAQPNQARVSTLLDASIRLQKQRIAVIEAEQKELAAFLTPVQRARYLALQAQFRSRADQLSRQNSGGRGRGIRRPPGNGAGVR
jgi:Spy/CpxP family protein refolding chaperone